MHTKWRLAFGVVAVIVLLAVLVVVFWTPIFLNIVHPLYTQAKLNTFEKESQTALKGQIVFLGDSVVDSWDLEAHFPEYPVYNLGIMGDSTSHVLQRLDSVYAFEPSVIVLLVGTNDFLNEGLSVAEAANNYGKILAEIQAHSPGTQVLCQSVYPGYDTALYKIERFADDILQLNDKIEAHAREYGYVYLDIYSLLIDASTGLANRAYFKDGIHPSYEGYALASEVIKQYIPNGTTA